MFPLRMVLGLLMCVTVSAQMSVAQAQSAGSAGEERVVVKTMVGQVEIRSSGAATWRPARIGLPVRMGWDIRTYVESKAELEFESGTIIRIGENSVVTLSKLLANKSSQESNSGIKVGTGQVWANVKKLTSTKSKFDFETPTAVASIRGTRLGINVGKDGTAIEVYEGRVMVRNKGSTKEFPVTANIRAIIRQGGNGVDLTKFTEKEVATSDVFNQPAKTDSTGKTDSTTTVPDTTKKADSTAAKADTTGLGKKLAAVALADSIRRAQLAKPDTTPATSSVRLTLQLTAPQDGITINNTQIPVNGKTAPGAKVTVNNAVVSVSPGGVFSTMVPIPDEPQDYTVNVVATLGTQEMDARATVTYKPAALPLTLTIATPFDGQVIKEKTIRVTGKTSPRATVMINGRAATVTPQGLISSEIALSERDIGSYPLEIVASDGLKDMSITRTVTIDVASPLINSNAPMITVSGLAQQATRTGQITVNVSDRTLEDVITLEVTNNATKQEYTMNSGDKQTIMLDPGKDQLTIRAFDKARNGSNVVTGQIYYLPGPLAIRITDPSANPLVFNGVPPMPRNVKAPSVPIRIELDDRINNVPESIMYCRITGNGQSILLRDNKDYSFTGELSVNPGANIFTIQAQDFAQNMATKVLTIIINK